MHTPTTELSYNPVMKVWRLPVDVFYGSILDPLTPKTELSEAILSKLEMWGEMGVVAITDYAALPLDTDAYILAFTPVKGVVGNDTLLTHLSVINTARSVSIPFKQLDNSLTSEVITNITDNLVDYNSPEQEIVTMTTINKEEIDFNNPTVVTIEVSSGSVDFKTDIGWVDNVRYSFLPPYDTTREVVVAKVQELLEEIELVPYDNLAGFEDLLDAARINYVNLCEGVVLKLKNGDNHVNGASNPNPTLGVLVTIAQREDSPEMKALIAEL